MSTYIIDSEPELTIGQIADADEFLVHDTSAVAAKRAGADTVRAYMHSGVVAVTAATLAVTAAAHAGRLVTLSRAAGIVVTLPAATGTGNPYKFMTITTVTSNDNIIKVTTTDIFAGLALTAQDAADTVNGWETAADSDTITMNGTTKGGIKGDMIEFIDAASGLWHIRAVLTATGTEVTPFSAGVS